MRELGSLYTVGVLILGITAFAPSLAAQTPRISTITNYGNYASVPAPLSPGSLAWVNGQYGDDLSITISGHPAGILKPLGHIPIPFDVDAGDSTAVITTKAGSSAPYPIVLEPFAPVLLKFGILCPFSRAIPGKVISAYALGLGQTNPPVAGALPARAASTLAKPSLTIGGQPAEILSSELVAWQAGTYQINFRVPAGLEAGQYPVPLAIDGKTGNSLDLTVTRETLWSSGPIAPESIAMAAGCDLGTSSIPVNGDPRNPPFTLDGIRIALTDSAGTVRPAPIVSASSETVRYVVPAGTVTGEAILTVLPGNLPAVSTKVQIARIVPVLYTVDGYHDAPAAFLVRVRDGVQTTEPLWRPKGDAFESVPIDFGPETDRLVLALLASGVRFRSSLANVKVQLYPAGVPDLTADYAGPQNEFAGVDQVNIALPRSLAGRGPSGLVLVVDDISSDVIYLTFK